ncbi:enoyl-CoA hydratase/isomerase family protein [Bacillus suaedaesalsae]|uniref:Enoyl-CoA hydratase/isomerase family protein n=1 Tax=Bacillus suaedaesalsae TaxID=2810349 RepID=A0ABS2DJ91_9BACI|nr:enoyl-CoA hydratase/isomerase family protein [Bacillus suaedaesalsae]MBM6618564.1 enoyl-CoA hydratase/isomerase family protein [Bacillus suaedaesalsae]
MKKTKLERLHNQLLLFTINRPDVRNAIDYQVMEGFKEAIHTVKQDSSIKGLIITGSGMEAFCSGGDLSVFHGLHTEEEAYSMLSKMGDILFELMTLNRPTFALMNGVAVGGGCEIATACDFRIAKESTKFGFIQGKLGITTGWGGGTMLLEKIPFDRACKMLYSANVIPSETGVELGFINQVFDEGEFQEEGIKWIEELLNNSSSDVLASYKAMSVRKWLSSNLKSRMNEEIKQCSILWEGEEHHHAVNAFLARKKN